MMPVAQKPKVRVSVILAWRVDLERRVDQHLGPSGDSELMELLELLNWLELTCEDVGLTGVTAATHRIKSPWEPIVHKGARIWMSEHSLVSVEGPNPGWWIERLSAQMGISDFTLALTADTFNAWSSSLDELAKADLPPTNYWSLDDRWERTARPALTELHRMAGDDIHAINCLAG